MAGIYTESLNGACIKFANPRMVELNKPEAKHYFVQDLKYNNTDLYLISEWFESTGIKTDFGKAEMLIKQSGSMESCLRIVEKEAKRQIQFPPEYGVKNEDCDKHFKTFPSTPFAYIKLARFAHAYNTDCQQISFNSLEYGRYRIVLHVRGIYIGSHGALDKLASLQNRIVQIQYDKIVMPCLFSSIPIPNKSVAQLTPNSKSNAAPMAVDSTPPAQTGSEKSAPSAPKKRRPKLQRQNAIRLNKTEMGETGEMNETGEAMDASTTN